MAKRICSALVLVAILAAGGALAQEEKPDAPDVRVVVDPRVELLSVIFRFAGNPEYQQGRVPDYISDVEKHFGAFRDHEVVKIARELSRTRGVSYDAVMGMAVHLKDAKTLEEAVPFDPLPESMDPRWTTPDARRFLAAARDFAKKSDFADFLKRNQKLYGTTVSRMKQMLEEDAGFDWFEGFFGDRPGATFTLALGMLNGGMCYGPRVQKGPGEEDLYCVLGVWSVDGSGIPRFDRSMLGTVAHEFCHSYANPLADDHAQALKSAGEAIYPHYREAMKRQAYSNWGTMMRESLVRACVIRYILATQGRDAAKKEAQAQILRSFVWVPELATLLGQYEADREKYPTLDAFMPRVAAFFDEYAKKFAKDRAEKAEKAPKVVSTVPSIGDRTVSPALTKIVVTFDRPMAAGGFSFVGGGPSFPQTTGLPTWSPDGKVITLPVKLLPDHSYEFWLNRGQYQAFRSRDGVPLLSVHFTFRTGAAR